MLEDMLDGLISLLLFGLSLILIGVLALLILTLIGIVG